MSIAVKLSLDESFEEYHRTHTEVYELLVLLARQVPAASHDRVGIAMLYEVAPWQKLVGSRGATHRPNNSDLSRVARPISTKARHRAAIRNQRAARLTFEVGDIVRCEREKPARGTWHRYAGREARVVKPVNYGEVGITWRIEASARVDSIDSWFLNTELVLVRARGEEGRVQSHNSPVKTNDDLRVPATARGFSGT